MIGDDDHLVAVPHFGVLSEFTFEDPNGTGSADVMGHQHIGFDPNIFTGLHAEFAGCAREDFFCKRHWREVNICSRQIKAAERPHTRGCLELKFRKSLPTRSASWVSSHIATEALFVLSAHRTNVRL